MKRNLIALTLIAAGGWFGAVWSCSSDAGSGDDPRLEELKNIGPDADLIAFLKDNFGVRVTGLEEAADFTYEDDGTLITSAEGTVTVDGLGSTDIYIHERIYPQATGGDVELYIEDKASGDNRYFYYDPGDAYIVFSRELPVGTNGVAEPERGAVVAHNEDGTYQVWTFDDGVAANRETARQVSNGYEALALVNESAEFNTIPPYIVLTAISLGYTGVPEARLPVMCTDTATRPPVCTIFKEFCDCAACAAGQNADCALCPQR